MNHPKVSARGSLMCAEFQVPVGRSPFLCRPPNEQGGREMAPRPSVTDPFSSVHILYRNQLLCISPKGVPSISSVCMKVFTLSLGMVEVQCEFSNYACSFSEPLSAMSSVLVRSSAYFNTFTYALFLNQGN